MKKGRTWETAPSSDGFSFELSVFLSPDACFSGGADLGTSAVPAGDFGSFSSARTGTSSFASAADFFVGATAAFAYDGGFTSAAGFSAVPLEDAVALGATEALAYEGKSASIAFVAFTAGAAAVPPAAFVDVPTG
eukprot:1184102-Prorocentrum_minimum.AAC.3